MTGPSMPGIGGTGTPVDRGATGLGDGDGCLDARLEVGEADRQVADERAVAARPDRVLGADAAHCCFAFSSSTSNQRPAVATSLSPRPESETSRVDPGRLAREPQGTGDRVGRLDGGDDALGAREREERIHRLGVGHGQVLGAADVAASHACSGPTPG